MRTTKTEYLITWPGGTTTSYATLESAHAALRAAAPLPAFGATAVVFSKRVTTVVDSLIYCSNPEFLEQPPQCPRL